MAYIFDPDVLRDVVHMHMHLPMQEQEIEVSKTLKDVYGDHIHPGQEWMWSNAGGVMCAMSMLHVSPREYLLFCGTAIGSEGHSGRHRSEIWDVVMAGELWTYRAGQSERTTYTAGDLAVLQRGESNGSKLRPGCWLLEYSRGNIPSMFPFALGDSIVSTLDLSDLKSQLVTANKLLAREWFTWLKERKQGRPAPNLDAIEPPRSSVASTRNGARSRP